MLRIIFCIVILSACNGQKTATPHNDSATAEKSKYPDVVIADSVPGRDTVKINFNKKNILLKPVPVVLKTGDSFLLNIPDGYRLSIAAEGLGRLRFLARSPDGKIFATDMHDRSDNKKGRILIFNGWNDTIKKYGRVSVFLDNLHNPNQVAFYKGYIYVAETGRLRRFTYHAGDERPSDTGQVIMSFPAYGLGYKYGGWHLTRSLAFKNDKLYVSIGSSCNACIEKEEIRASIIEMNPDGTGVNFYARGLRNSVGLKWIGSELWATGMGRDLIGPDRPEDLFQRIERNGYYGWPYYYQYHQRIYEDKTFKDSSKANWVKAPPLAFLGFKAHSAPLGFEHFKNFDDSVLNNSILVCLHGSTSVWRERGNSIVRIENGNIYRDVVTGFLTGKTENERHGRPCDILMNDQRSFFFTDDLNGILYFLWKK